MSNDSRTTPILDWTGWCWRSSSLPASSPWSVTSVPPASGPCQPFCLEEVRLFRHFFLSVLYLLSEIGGCASG